MVDCTQILKKIVFLLANANIIGPASITNIIHAKSQLGQAFADIDIDMRRLLQFPWTNFSANKTDTAVPSRKEKIKVRKGLYSDLDLDDMSLDQLLFMGIWEKLGVRSHSHIPMHHVHTHVRPSRHASRSLVPNRNLFT